MPGNRGTQARPTSRLHPGPIHNTTRAVANRCPPAAVKAAPPGPRQAPLEPQPEHHPHRTWRRSAARGPRPRPPRPPCRSGCGGTVRRPTQAASCQPTATLLSVLKIKPRQHLSAQKNPALLVQAVALVVAGGLLPHARDDNASVVEGLRPRSRPVQHRAGGTALLGPNLERNPLVRTRKPATNRPNSDSCPRGRKQFDGRGVWACQYPELGLLSGLSPIGSDRSPIAPSS